MCEGVRTCEAARVDGPEGSMEERARRRCSWICGLEKLFSMIGRTYTHTHTHTTTTTTTTTAAAQSCTIIMYIQHIDA